MNRDFVQWLEPMVGQFFAWLLAPTYLEFLLGGLFLSCFLVLHRLQRRGDDLIPVLGACFWGYVGMVAGARLMWMALNPEVYIARPDKLFHPFQGGFASFGAMAGAAIAVFLFLRKNKLAFLPFADAFAPGVAIGLGVARIGCFLGGCCHGLPTDAWYGISFPAGTMPWRTQLIGGLLQGYGFRSLPTYPVQLFEALVGIVLFVILSKMWASKKFHGQVLASFFVLYGLGRFFAEFMRGDPRMMIGSHSAVQVMSFVMFLSGLVLYWNYKRDSLMQPATV